MGTQIKSMAVAASLLKPTQCYPSREDADSHFKTKSGLKSQAMSLNDLEFAYAPVRDQVRDLREYL
jgi:hypothetical protein